MTISLITGLVTQIIGIVYLILTFQIPDASLGLAAEPKIFPSMLGILVVILGTAITARELLKLRKISKKEKSDFQFGYSEKKIALTVLNALLYTLLFNRLGYVFSTFIFLELELLLFNGLKKWKITTIVSLSFSLFIFIIFNKLLGVYLPQSSLGWI